MEFAVLSAANKLGRNGKSAVAIATLLALSLPAVAVAESVEDSELTRRARFMVKCEQTEFNEQCAKFYESAQTKKRSARFCEANPEDVGCHERESLTEVSKESRRELAVQREISNYCKENADAPRCIERKLRRNNSQRGSTAKLFR